MSFSMVTKYAHSPEDIIHYTDITIFFSKVTTLIIKATI